MRENKRLKEEMTDRMTLGRYNRMESEEEESEVKVLILETMNLNLQSGPQILFLNSYCCK